MKFWQKSLQARLTLYFILFLLIAGVTLGVLAYWQSRTALQEDVIRRLETAAILKENEITRWLAEKRQTVRLVAQTPIVKTLAVDLLGQDESDPAFNSAYESLTAYLNRVLKESPDILHLLILDQEGQVILSTDTSQEDNFHVTDTFFIEGLKDTYSQNVYFLPTINRTTITLATPLDLETGQERGVLVAHLDLNRLDEIVLDRAGLGETGETYLVDSLNVFIAQARVDQAAFPRGVHTEGIDRALSGENGNALYLNYEGMPVIGVYRWLADQEMALLAEIEQGEALAPVNDLGLVIILITLVVIGLVSVAGYLIARQISRPVLAIAETASQVAVGNLKQRVPVMTKDEIGSLALAFNQMTAQLEELYTTLEERIEARTRRLEIVATLGERLSGILNLESLMIEVVNQIKESFGYYHAHIYLIDDTGENLVLAAGTGEAGAEMKAQGHAISLNANSLVARSARSGKIVNVADVREVPDWLPNPLLPNTCSEMAVPIMLEGRVNGVLDVQDDDVGGLDEGDENLLRSLANQVAVAIRNARLFEQIETALAEARAAQEKYISEAWQKTKIAPKGHRYLYTSSEVVQFDEEKQNMVAELQRRALEQEGPTILEDEPRAIVAPIRLGQQKIGAVQLYNSHSQPVLDDELAIIEAIIDQFAQTAENLRLFEETRERAGREQTIREITDRLRAAPNLGDLLETAARELGQRLGVPHTVMELGIQSDEQQLMPDQNGQIAGNSGNRQSEG
ncbi:MAG: GAF domain-containing protein [Anaerolineae bacterium]|nr:GAF domain-containing protein [Anaerolineae bacterium]